MTSKKPFNYEYWSRFADRVYILAKLFLGVYLLWLYEVVVVRVNMVFDVHTFGEVSPEMKRLWEILTGWL